MRNKRKRLGVILAAYALGSLFLLNCLAKRIMGQQPAVKLAVTAPTVRPAVHPIVSQIVVPEIGPINTGLNTDLSSELNSDVNSNVNLHLNSGLNSELSRNLGSTISETVAPPAAAFADVVVNGAKDDDEFRISDQETIHKSFTLPANDSKSLEIDNIWGSIEVTADASDKVEMTVVRTNRAESKEKLEKAKKEVTLEISQDGGALKLYVNGPFRCHCDDCRHSRDDEGYVVKMDFELHVPKDIAVQAKTVNEGHVRVRGTNGDFSLRNVNGDIEMENVSGSGTARTVNGPVKVSFRQNPKENSDFKTVNGSVELTFAHDLSADFRFKTFNGGIYSDFPVTALPLHPMEAEHRGAKVIYRADRYAEARVNAGGPQIQIENLNGDIRILENHE